MKLTDEITEVLESTHCEHVNRHGVKIEVEDCCSFSANSNLLEYVTEAGNDTSVSVELFCNKSKFVRLLHIEKSGDIENITQQQLLQSYQDGNAEIVCFVDLIYSCCMVFKKQGAKIIAKNERNELHDVTFQLVTPDEYIDYTQKYYMLREYYSEN